MLSKILDLNKLLDMTPRLKEREIINEDKYLEKYKQRINDVLKENWIDDIKESCSQEERENYKIGKKREYGFPFGYTKHKTVFYNEKYDKDIVLMLESKQYVLNLLTDKKKTITDLISLELIEYYIELVERIYYIDMFEHSKMNAYRIYDNLTILRDLFKNISIMFVKKFTYIERELNIKEHQLKNHSLLNDLEYYENYIENCSFEIFYNLENILEELYIFYVKNEENERIEKTKSFFLDLLVEIYVKWIPSLEYLDSELKKYSSSIPLIKNC